MIRIYAVYVDIYFIGNVIMDAQLLAMTQLLLRERIVPWRLALASLAGGAGAVLAFWSGERFGAAGYTAFALLLDIAMLALCMGGVPGRRDAPQKIAMGVIYLHGLAFAYTRLMECAGRLSRGWLPQIAPAAALSGIVALILACRRFAQRQRIYEVTLTENGENIAARALFDTGNLLKDPVSGKPVSVIEETEMMRQWIAKYPQKYKLIPYQSIGNAHGLLEGIVVDELVIRRGEEQVIKREAVVALYQGKLSKDGAFQMILNHSLM